MRSLFLSSVAILILPFFLFSEEYTKIDRDFPSNHCEFYVNSFAMGYWYYNGTTVRYMKTDIKISPHVIGTVVDVGIMIEVDNKQSKSVEFISSNSIIQPNQITYPIEIKTEVRKEFKIESSKNIIGFKYFIAVKSNDGSIKRLWLFNNGNYFNLDNVYDHFNKYPQILGKGHINWVAERNNPLFYQKQSCGWY